jgi:hypothetical protein
MVSNFQCIFLRNFKNNFPTVYIGNGPEDNNYIIKGFKLSYKRKREFCILFENTNNLQVKIIKNNAVQF